MVLRWVLCWSGGLNIRFISQTYDGMTVLCGYATFMLCAVVVFIGPWQNMKH